MVETVNLRTKVCHQVALSWQERCLSRTKLSLTIFARSGFSAVKLHNHFVGANYNYVICMFPGMGAHCELHNFENIVVVWRIISQTNFFHDLFFFSHKSAIISKSFRLCLGWWISNSLTCLDEHNSSKF